MAAGCRGAAQVGQIQGLLWRGWLRSLGVGLFVFLGILGGIWGLTQWLSSSVQSHIEARAAIRLEIEQERRTLDQLRPQTWGVWLHEAEDGGGHVVLPQGTFEDWPWTVQGQPAIRLSSECGRRISSNNSKAPNPCTHG